MHQNTGIQTGQDSDTIPSNSASLILQPSTKGATTVIAAKKLATTLSRFARQPLVICSGTKVPITFHVSPTSPKQPATSNPKPTTANTAVKSPTLNPATKLPSVATMFATPHNNNIGLVNLLKSKLPIAAATSLTKRSIISSQTIPTVSATIKRPAIFNIQAPAVPPKTSPVKRPNINNNAKHAHVQTNTGAYPKGIVLNDVKTNNRKRSMVGSVDEGPPNKKLLDDDGEICPVCLDPCTNSGDHRLVALKCGHLFGANCIKTWLRTNKKCPTCQRRAILPDLRNIYARKLAGPDPVEKPSVRSIGVRAVRRSKRRRRYMEAKPQEADQNSEGTL